MPDQFGSVKKTITNKSESHKLHQTFVVATGVTVYEGIPVKLTATGTVTPATAGEAPVNIIGYATQTAGEAKEVTIAMKGQRVVNALAKEILVPGPAKYDSFDTTVGLPVYSGATVTVSNCVGHILDVATAASDEIRVVLF